MAAPDNNSRVGLASSMASAGARAYNGSLGAEPPAGVQSGGKATPPEADGILVLEHAFLRSPGDI